MTRDLETDYLVIGCGSSGMAFTDEIVTHSDATVTIVDRRHAPGGHWVDAYPFVRLHQPSAFYGVGSAPLGKDRIDETGTNAGFYELAGPDEIRAYYEQVMHRRFLPSGRVRYFPNCDYVGEGRFASHVSGAMQTVDVRRRVVDTTYLEGSIPATTPPPFEVGEEVRCVPVGELPRVVDAPDRFVIVGAGKTAMDACVWLLERGVEARAITWIKPREAWWLNREFNQPFDLLPNLYVGTARQYEAMALAETIDDLFIRLEAAEFFRRVDRDVTPTMFRAAIVSEAELALLRKIDDVVRLGHVSRIDADAITLDGGSVPTTANTLHVHCAGQALPRRESVPVFSPGQIMVQPLRWGFSPFQAALTAFVEVTVDTDDEKNALCPPMKYPDRNVDFLSDFLVSMAGDRARRRHPAVNDWVHDSRLNPGGGLRSHLTDPRVREALESIKGHARGAATNLTRLLAEHAAASGP